MKIIVCVSLVPDSTTKVKIADNGKSIDENGVSYILNPYDEFAVEEALQLKEKNGGEVIAVSFGGDKAKDAIKKAFQMGADKGVLIRTSDSEFDSFTTATNLSEYIKSQSPDLVLLGKQSIDFDSMLIPSMISEMTGLPSTSVVVKLEINGNAATAEREIEGGKEILQFNLPALVGVQKGINDPRYPNLKSIMAAKSKPIEEINATYNGNRVSVVEMNMPPTKASGKLFTNGKEDVSELVKLLREEAKVI